MAVTVQMQCESAVTEIYQDAFVGSAIEMARRLSCLIYASMTFKLSWGRRPSSVGARTSTMSLCMNWRHSTIR